MHDPQSHDDKCYPACTVHVVLAKSIHLEEVNTWCCCWFVRFHWYMNWFCEPLASWNATSPADNRDSSTDQTKKVMGMEWNGMEGMDQRTWPPDGLLHLVHWLCAESVKFHFPTLFAHYTDSLVVCSPVDPLQLCDGYFYVCISICHVR